MSGIYGIWCPVCKAEINSVTRGIPSMGICQNGHKTDRRDCLHRDPDTRTPDPAQIRADAIREALEKIEQVKNDEYSIYGLRVARHAILALLDTPLSPTVDGSIAPDAGTKGQDQ